jgi:hypothetical protein
MPSIKCTAKLAKRAGFKIEAPIEDTREDWHANLFNLNRRTYVIFCHDVTRLSVLAGPVLKAGLQDLPSLLRGNLKRVLKNERFSDTAIDHAVSRLEGLSLAKTNNRSVLGTINDNIFHTEVHAHMRGGVEMAGLETLAHFLNHMPMGPLNMDDAIEAYRRSNLHRSA